MTGPGTAIEYPQIANYANQFAHGRQEKGTSIDVKDSSRAMSLPCACLVTAACGTPVHTPVTTAKIYNMSSRFLREMFLSICP